MNKRACKIRYYSNYYTFEYYISDNSLGGEFRRQYF